VLAFPIRADGSAGPARVHATGVGLDGPTACAFGLRGDNQQLYVNNAAFPFFSVTHRPSILRVAIGVPGHPR
jgi:hypothetical protein